MNQERLLKVLVAPVISEKSTMVAEKLNQPASSSFPTPTRPRSRLLLNCSSRCRSNPFKS